MKTIIDSLKTAFYILILLAIVYSCSNNNSKKNPNKINFQSINATNKTPFIAKNFIKNIDYIKLQLTNPNSVFSEISKIQIRNNLIYVLDATGQHFVYIFNMDGSFVQRIGKKGKGPGEYTKLCDFDVDEKGNIYLCDRQKMKIIVYDIHNKLISEKKLPFRADAFTLLNEGNYIFSVQLNSSKSLDKSKVIITDSTLNIKRQYFKYNKNCLDDKRSNSIFRKNKYGILYNKPVNDTIYQFDNNGEILDAFYFDFGIKAVTQELKNSYEKLIIERNKVDFEYFYQPPLRIGNYIIGNILSGKSKAFILYDLKSKITYQHEIAEEKFNNQNINFPLGILNDTVVVSYLDFQLYQVIEDKSNLSPEIQSHIQNGGLALTFYTLK